MFFDDDMDDLLNLIPLESPEKISKVCHQTSDKKSQYSIKEIMDIIDNIDVIDENKDQEVIASSQSPVHKKVQNTSEKCEVGDLDDMFCDSESDIFRTSSLLRTDNCGPSAPEITDENSTDSNKTVEYNFDGSDELKKSLIVSPEINSRNSSILSKELVTSPSIFSRILSNSRITHQMSNDVHNSKVNVKCASPSSPVSSKPQKSFDLSRFSYAKNKMTQKAPDCREIKLNDVPCATQSPVARVARNFKARIISSDEEESVEEVFLTCKSVRIFQNLIKYFHNQFIQFTDTIKFIKKNANEAKN